VERDGGAPKVPATLYERWRAAFRVDGVAFGKRVRELREERGWSQEDLQARTGVSESTISEVENGRYAQPRVALGMTLAQAFGYEHPAALLGLPEPPRPPGAHPAGPRAPGAAPEGPGPLTLEALVASLLRGVWAAQDARPDPPVPAPAAGPVVAAPLAGEAAPGPQGELPGLRALGGLGTPVFVGAVFLVDPKTVG
jgi:putative transcriptional regulator